MEERNLLMWAEEGQMLGLPWVLKESMLWVLRVSHNAEVGLINHAVGAGIIIC